VTLSVIIPTLGRETLPQTLASCADADEIVVVLDTARGGSPSSLPPLPPNAVLIEGCWGVTGGHAGRQVGIQRASGTHLAFMDDDDVYTSGAIATMRNALGDVPVIFRMDDPLHGVIWREPEIRWANVSTQMYVVPNVPDKLGSWTPHMPGLKCPGGDFTFISETVENFGGVVWREEVTSVIRPGKSITIVTPWKDHPELAEDYAEAVGRARSTDEVIVVKDSPGFVWGCNQGLQQASCDVVLFLNNDIRLADPDWLEVIRAAVEPDVLVGPLRNGGHSDVDGQSFPYIDGWCLAGMREDLLRLGGFDERLEEPAYYSDNLLCLEARAAGMTLRDVQPGLEHLENVTAGDQFTPTVQAAATTNRAIYQARARAILG
jgi:glycosyltransferase involved in cell wall biosynthesis